MIGFLYVGVLKCTYSLPQIETRKSLTLSFSLNKTKQNNNLHKKTKESQTSLFTQIYQIMNMKEP